MHLEGKTSMKTFQCSNGSYFIKLSLYNSDKMLYFFIPLLLLLYVIEMNSCHLWF